MAPTRARIELVGLDASSAAPTIQSTFTTTLTDFLYIDPKGKKWGGIDVPPGQRVKLSAYVPPRSGGGMDALRTRESRLPGHFFALGGATDLAPISTLSSIRWVDDSVVYTGVVEDKP
jgi:hypothetical protein